MRRQRGLLFHAVRPSVKVRERLFFGKVAQIGKLLAAGRLMDKYRDITQKIETQKNYIWIKSGIPSFGRVVYRLLVQGKGEMKLIYDSLKGGYYTTTANLK